MDNAVQVCGFLIGLTLEVLIISALLRGGFRRFPLPFAYIVAVFLTTNIDFRFWIAQLRHPGDRSYSYQYQWFYWRDEALLQLLVFAVVISLIYYSIERFRSRRMVLLVLAPGAVLFAGISFLVHYKPGQAWIGVWMTPWTRDLYVVSTVLDLALWAILIAAKDKNYRLLMLSGALGIQFTGEAIGESLRNLAQRRGMLLYAGNLLIMLTNLAAMYIWWQAFREHTHRDLPAPPIENEIGEPSTARRLPS